MRLSPQRTLPLLGECSPSFIRSKPSTRYTSPSGRCDDVGRDYTEIERAALGTAYLPPDGISADDVIGPCRELNDAGVQHLIFNMPSVHELSQLETFGEKIIPTVAEL